MIMAMHLPTVTEYIKNMGRSVAYAAVDAIQEPTENLSDFAETNEELFKVIYSATKNYKRTIQAADKAIKQSKIYEAAQIGINNIKDDLKTGKFYNKEREQRTNMEAFGDDFADFSDFEDIDFGDPNDWNDDEDNEPIDSNTKASIKAQVQTSAGLSDTIAATSRAQSNVIARSTEAMANVNMTSTKVIVGQTEKIYSGILTGFSTMNAGLNLTANILQGPLQTHIQNSTKFYEDVSSKLNETTALLKELTEMQRNLYKAQEKEWKDSKYDEVVGANGMPDLTAYAKRIYKNIKDLDPTGGMMAGDGDENLFKMFVGSPLKAIPQMLTKLIIPTAVTKSLKLFDETMSGVFSIFVSRMNSWMNEDAVDGINYKGILGKIFGIGIDRKTSIDTSKFQRGPMPFDGETKRAITDIIPAYLARIEAAVSGMPERVYDMKSGKFKTIREVQKEFQELDKRGARNTFYSLDDDFEKWAQEQAKAYGGSNESMQRRYDELKKNYERVAMQVYKDKGDFRPFKGMGKKGEEGYETYDYAMSQEDMKSFMDYIMKHNKQALSKVAQNAIEAIQMNNRELENAEGGFGNIYTALADGRINILDDKGRLTYLNPSSNTKENKELYKKNSRFKSATDYLKDILAEVSWIRQRGIGNSNFGNGSSGNNPGPFIVGPGGASSTTARNLQTFDEFKESLYGDDTYEEDYIKQTVKNWKKEKEETEAEKYGLTKENLKELDAAKTITGKWDAAKKAVDKLLRTPAKWATDVISKADERIYKLFFGDENGETFRDKHGLQYKGLLDFMVGKISMMFEDIQDKMKKTWDKFFDWFTNKTAIGKWMKEKGQHFLQTTGAALKSKLGTAKSRIGLGLRSTFGEAAYSLSGGYIDFTGVDKGERFRHQREATLERERIARMSDEQKRMYAYRQQTANFDPSLLMDPTMSYYRGDQDSVVTDQDDTEDIYNDITNNQRKGFARGGKVKRTGLYSLSKGEYVIPNDRKQQSKDLKKERAVWKRFRGKARVDVAKKDNDSKSIWEVIKTVSDEVSGNDGGGEIAANALIGGGVSLVTGMFGGPILGAAAGAGLGILKNSETAKRILFGEMGEDGKRKGNLISKETIEKFNSIFTEKNKNSMTNGAIVGSVLSLVTPFGLVGGALAGATAGYVKNTNWFQDFMFGNEAKGKTGVMSQETKKKIQKAYPRIGAGMLGGALLGPFGLVGNLMLGGALGYVSSTDKFKEIFFGKEDKDGKRHGGIYGAFKKGFVDPIAAAGKNVGKNLSEWIKKTIISPLKLSVEVLGNAFKSTALSIGDRISDALNSAFKKHIGMPVEEFLREKVFKKMASVTKFLGKVTKTIAKFTIGLPFTMLGGFMQTRKSRMIAKGQWTTDDAAARLKDRQDHKIAMGMQYLNPFVRGDRSRDFDELLAGMDSGQLTELAGDLNKLKTGRRAKNKEYLDAVNSVGNNITDFLDQNNLWNSNGYNMKKLILNFIQEENNPDDVRNAMKRYGLSDKQADNLMSSIDFKKLSSMQAAANKELGIDEYKMKKLQKALGYKDFRSGNNRGIKQALRLIDTEMRSKKSQEDRDGVTPSTPGNQEPKTPEETMVNQFDNVIKLVSDIKGFVVDKKMPDGHKADTSTNPMETISNKSGNTSSGNTESTDTNSGESRNEENDGNYVMNTIHGPIRFINGSIADDARSKIAYAKEVAKEKAQEALSKATHTLTTKIGDFLGLNKKKDDDEQPSLISRIFGGMKDIGTNIMGIIGGGMSKLGGVGAIAGGIVGLSLLGWGGKFVKETLMPAIEKSPLFNKIKDFITGIPEKIPKLVEGLVSKLSQGLMFAVKNVVPPMISAVIKCLPGLAIAIAKGAKDGIVGLFKGGQNHVETSFGSVFDQELSKLPTGKDEKEIAKNFSGGGNYKIGSSANLNISDNNNPTINAINNTKINTTNIPSYEQGTTVLDNGTVVEKDEYGNINMHDKHGNVIASYNEETGEFTQTNRVYGEGAGLRALKGGLRAGLNGSNVAAGIGKGVVNAGRRVFSSKSIVKSGIKAASGGVLGLLTHGVAAGAKGIGRTVTEAANVGMNLGNNAKILSDIIGRSGFKGIADVAANGVANAGDDLGRAIRELGKKTAQETAEAASNVAGNAVQNTIKDKAGDMVEEGATSIAKRISAFGSKLATNNKLLSGLSKFIGGAFTQFRDTKVLGEFLKNLMNKISEKCGTSLAGKAASGAAKKILGAIGRFSPIAVALWIKSFYDGWAKMESKLGITVDAGLELGAGARFVCGLINMINENLLFGIIPVKTLMNIVIDIFGDHIGLTKESLAAAEAKSAEILSAAGVQAGRTVSAEEYNKQDGAWGAVKRFFTGNKAVTYQNAGITQDTNKNNFNQAYNEMIGNDPMLTGKGRGGKQGGMYSALKYGSSTIGEAGCAPVAAATMLGGNDIPGAARFAQKTGHVAPDGSTDIGYFKDYFASKGVPSATTTDKSTVANSLKRGGSAVMLGRDPGGGVESAYSNQSHYITAKGNKDGTVTVNDPELGMRKMSQSKVLKNMKASVLTGKGRGEAMMGSEMRDRGIIDKTNKWELDDALRTAGKGDKVKLSLDQKIEKVVQTALGEKGTTEKGYNNDNKYGREYGLNYQPWCCIFVWWVFNHAGCPQLFYGGGKVASCTALYNYYAANGQAVKTIRKGDLVFFDFNHDGKIQHIGIAIEDQSNTGVRTIEGNTASSSSGGSQDNGGGVYVKDRKFKDIIAVARPAYDSADFADALPAGSSYDFSSGEETSGSKSKLGNLFESIKELGKIAMKSIFGEKLYNAVFGDDTSENSGEGFNGDISYGPPSVDADGNLIGSTVSEQAYRYLRSKGYSKEGAAGILGNLEKESGIRANNLQNTYEKSLGMTDKQYTDAVNSGSRTREQFARDSAGYGLAQWTYSSRKRNLYDRTLGAGMPIDSVKGQLDHLDKELDSYGLSEAFKRVTSVQDASNKFLYDFEKPASASSQEQSRGDAAQKYYDMYKDLSENTETKTNAYGMTGSEMRERGLIDNTRNTGMTGSEMRNRGMIYGPVIKDKDPSLSGKGRDDIGYTSPNSPTNNMSYTHFMETIITVLMSIADNTEAISKISELLSKQFNVDLDTSAVKKAANSTRERARQAINEMMGNKADAEEMSGILQSKDTDYLIRTLTEIARQ